MNSSAVSPSAVNSSAVSPSAVNSSAVSPSAVNSSAVSPSAGDSSAGPSIVTIVGNPRAGSRTHRIAAEAAAYLAGRIGLPGPEQTIDLTALGPHLLSPVPSADVEVAVELAVEARFLLVASPTYKGTYTGLLKAFLDRLPAGALAGTVAFPLLVMADPRHTLAVEVHLRPLLVELGALVPTPGLAVLDSQLPELDDVLGRWADQVVYEGAAVPTGTKPEAVIR